MYALKLLLKQFAFVSSPALTSIWHQISINAQPLKSIQQITILHIVRGTRFISGCTTPHCSLRRFTVADIIRCLRAQQATGCCRAGLGQPACERKVCGTAEKVCGRSAEKVCGVEKSLRCRRESLRQIRRESLRCRETFAVSQRKFAVAKILRSRKVCGGESVAE